MLTIPPDKKLWFTGCLHIRHKNIIKYCTRPFLCDKDKAEFERRGKTWSLGFETNEMGETWEKRDKDYKIADESVAIMDEHLISKINEYVGPKDYLVILGDLSYTYNNHQIDEVISKYAKVKCKNIWTVRGNHDDDKTLMMVDHDNAVRDLIQIKYGDDFIVGCHYAMRAWNHSFRGSYNVYSHSHGELEEQFTKEYPQRRSIDCGVDNACRLFGEYRPMEWNEIKGKINEQ